MCASSWYFPILTSPASKIGADGLARTSGYNGLFSHSCFPIVEKLWVPKVSQSSHNRVRELCTLILITPHLANFYLRGEHAWCDGDSHLRGDYCGTCVSWNPTLIKNKHEDVLIYIERIQNLGLKKCQFICKNLSCPNKINFIPWVNREILFF